MRYEDNKISDEQADIIRAKEKALMENELERSISNKKLGLVNEGPATALIINSLVSEVYTDNIQMGWYSDPATGQRKERNVGEMLALIHSEVSEALEGYRKNLYDDHLPNRSMIEVELADVIIRVFDLAGYLSLDLGGAYIEKRAYNAKRQDHKLEARRGEHGKKI